MLEGNNISNVNASLEKCNITSQPTECPTFVALKSNAFNGTDDIHGIQGNNFTSISKNETNIVSSDFPKNVVTSTNTFLDVSEVKSSSSSVTNSSWYPSPEPTMIPTNISLPAKEGPTTTNSSEPSNWYDYWRTSSTPTPKPTHAPTYYPTAEPSLDPDGPTTYPTQAAKVSQSSSNGQSYELISSMTALVFIGIIAAALYATKRHLGRKRKSKSKVVIRSPFFSELSKRVKERKKLMEEYFAVDAAECNILNHRSAASSIDLQVSTEFIDISRENQQSIF